MATPYTICGASNATPATSVTIVVATATTAGDQILVGVSAPSAPVNPATITVTDDSTGNNYIFSSQSGTVFVFMSTGATTALTTSNHITVTFGASSTYAVVAVGCSSILYQTVDTQATGTGTSTAPSAQSPGTSYWTETAFALLWNNSTSGPSAWGGGYTKITGAANASGQGVAATGNIEWASRSTDATFNSTGPLPSATTTNVAWKMISIVMPNQMWTPGTIPALNAIPAGNMVQPADMNSMSLVAAFLLNKPIARIQDFVGSQTIDAEGQYVTFSQATMDTDDMWSPNLDKARLTINTPGFYKLRYGIVNNGISFNAWVSGTGGPNNPQPGNVVAEWGCFGEDFAGGTMGAGGASGLWPFYLYQGDYLRIFAQNQGASMQTAITDSGSFFSLEWVGF